MSMCFNQRLWNLWYNLLADDHVIFIESKDELQRTVSRLENKENAFDTRILATKTKIIAFYVGNHERREIDLKK